MIPWLALVTLASAAESLTLEEALDRAAHRPTVHAAQSEATAARADATTAWLGSLGPRVGGSLTTTTRTREIAIDTPIGAFVQQPKDVAEAGLRGSWPLLNPAGVFGTAPAAQAGARAAELALIRATDQARFEAGSAYLDVVAIDARISALDGLTQSLSARQDQAEALVAAGLSVNVDRLRLDVALAETEVARVRLTAGREAAIQALAWRLGSDTPVQPTFVWTRPAEPDPLDAVHASASTRPDLAALDQQRLALVRQQRATWLEALPTLGVWGQLSWTNNAALVDNQWIEGGLEVRWTPVAGGTRASRARATAQRRRAVEARQRDAERGVRAELAQSRAVLLGSLAEVDARTLAVTQAAEAERLLAARYGQGLAPLTDVLQATSTLAEQRANLALAQIEASRAGLAWRFAHGQPVRAP